MRRAKTQTKKATTTGTDEVSNQLQQLADESAALKKLLELVAVGTGRDLSDMNKPGTTNRDLSANHEQRTVNRKPRTENNK